MLIMGHMNPSSLHKTKCPLGWMLGYLSRQFGINFSLIHLFSSSFSAKTPKSPNSLNFNDCKFIKRGKGNDNNTEKQPSYNGKKIQSLPMKKIAWNLPFFSLDFCQTPYMPICNFFEVFHTTLGHGLRSKKSKY